MTISQIKNLYKNNMELWTTMTSIKSEEEISTLWNDNFVEAGDGRVSRFYEKFVQEFGTQRSSEYAISTTSRNETRTVPAASRQTTPIELVKAGLQHLVSKNAPLLVGFEPKGPICWIESYSKLAGERFPLPPSAWETSAVGGTSSLKGEICYSKLTYSYKSATVVIVWNGTTYEIQ